MKWYTFYQFTDCGRLIGPDYVIVVAPNSHAANATAELHGIYFDGCEKHLDCPHCGDRWLRVDEDCGNDSPSIFGEPATPSADTLFVYLDGRVEGGKQ